MVSNLLYLSTCFKPVSSETPKKDFLSMGLSLYKQALPASPHHSRSHPLCSENSSSLLQTSRKSLILQLLQLFLCEYLLLFGKSDGLLLVQLEFNNLLQTLLFESTTHPFIQIRVAHSHRISLLSGDHRSPSDCFSLLLFFGGFRESNIELVCVNISFTTSF